jgi:predicted nucleic-acid-binding Zn-ribbon protein
MRLTEEQRENVSKRITSYWGDQLFDCPVCRNKHWKINDTIFEMREFSEGKLDIAGKVFPVIIIICDRCGYTITFNAIMLGVVKAESPAEEVKHG